MHSRLPTRVSLLFVCLVACGRQTPVDSDLTGAAVNDQESPAVTNKPTGPVPPSGPSGTGSTQSATTVPPAKPLGSDGQPVLGTTTQPDLPQPPLSTTTTATSSATSGGTTAPTTSATGEPLEPGAGGTGSVSVPEPSRGPTPPANGANFPFPQNRQEANCTYPTAYDNNDVIAAFEKWKRDTVTADGAGEHLRVKRPNEPGLQPNSTVSEGIAYGLLIAVYMNDQHLFDELWKYEQSWLDPAGLMNWYINAEGTDIGRDPGGEGAASDADADMAWALVMADRQWGGAGTLSDTYLNYAKDTIGKIWATEVADGKLLKPGDGWGSWDTVNVSYFTPSYFRVFATVSENAGWLDVVTTSYDIIEKSLNDASGNTANGLVPAWCNGEGSPNGGVWGEGQTAPTHYQYDSCRTPFRIGLDYCMQGETRAQQYVQKTSGFFAGIGVANIVDGYDLNGTPHPQESGGQSAAFIGPAGVGAMHDPMHQAFIDDAYHALRGLDLLVGGDYYEESWTVLSLLMMTGNFLDYTKLTPAQ